MRIDLAIAAVAACASLYVSLGAPGLVTPARAQQGDAPLSAIDWLSDSVATPVALPVAPQPPAGDIATNALPEDVTVAPLGGPQPDAVGLKPAAVLGLPPGLWAGSTSTDIAQRLQALDGDMLPAQRDLVRDLLIAALDPPADSRAEATLFLARIDTLLELAMLDEADALLDRAGPASPEIFRRLFDVRLLLGSEDAACEMLVKHADLAPTVPARIFCLARSGDWDAAALTLETAKALDMLSPSDDALLAAFLHPELAEETPPPLPPDRPSPLIFRIYEAIGEPMPTQGLPMAFAHADLRENAGWKARAEAAERLARIGALPPERLRAIWTERLPAASGGLWDRIAAFQRFDRAMARGDAAAIAAALPPAWEAMVTAELEVPFAQLYGPALAGVDLEGAADQLAFRIGLLSDAYEALAAAAPAGDAPTNTETRFLAGLARGDVTGLAAPSDHAAAIAEGFAAEAPPARLRSLTDEGRLGEAILRAMNLVTNGARGDLDELADGFAFLRAAGLEETARRTALQMLILDRRG